MEKITLGKNSRGSQSSLRRRVIIRGSLDLVFSDILLVVQFLFHFFKEDKIMRWMSLQSTDDVVIGTEVGQSPSLLPDGQ